MTARRCGPLGHVFAPWSTAGERCACGRWQRNESERGLVRLAELQTLDDLTALERRG